MSSTARGPTAGYVIEFLFGGLGLIPRERNAQVMTESVQWNYTTWLNIVFLILAVVLVVRFLRSGGREMMTMMGGGPDEMSHHDHQGSRDEAHDHAAPGDHPRRREHE